MLTTNIRYIEDPYRAKGKTINLRARLIIGLLLICLFINPDLKADDPYNPLKTIIPPNIDGILDDNIWKRSKGFTDFKTYMPDFGKDVQERTIAYISYDNENLYFAFKCYDREPEKIKTSVSARDKSKSDDFVCVNLDSNNDRQVQYTFYVNPSGIQTDARSGGSKEDLGVDLIWESVGAFDKDGYNVEIKIPFKSLRYSRNDTVQMGVILERKISRHGSQSTYPALDASMGVNFLLQNMKFNLYNIKHFTLLEVLPAVTYNNIITARKGKLSTAINKAELSFTGKIGISSDLILDVTYNPDFSQVESDVGQIEENQRYDLYYPEKRQFFLEGNEHYFFAGSEQQDPLKSIVHTRQIANPELGIKIAGKIGSKNHLATMFAIDKISDEISDSIPEYANFSIVRYKRSFKNDNYIGFFYTGKEEEQAFNRLSGTDGRIRLNKSSFIGYHSMVSFTKDSLINNTEAESAIGIIYKYGTRNTDIKLGITNISDNFQTKTGYLTRNGIRSANFFISPKFYPSKGIILKIGPLFSGKITLDKPSGLYEYNISPGIQIQLLRTLRISSQYNLSSEIYRKQKFKTNDFYLTASSQITKKIFFSTVYRGGKRIRYIENPYQGKGNALTFTAMYEPVNNFSTELIYTYSDLYKFDNNEKVFDYNIIRSKNTYQLNKYLFFRAIIEYNTYDKDLVTDFLASFTYTPGTVVHIGYGSMYERTKWNGQQYVDGTDLLETKRGFFFKASYLWRL
ncbi:sugar-binding protein [Bacteroidota bacterium]